MKKFVLKFMLVGGLVPIFLLLSLATQDYFIPHLAPNYALILSYIFTIALVFCPTFLMAKSLTMLIIAIITNILLYGILGIFIWFGIKRKKRLFLAPLAGVIGLTGYFLFTKLLPVFKMLKKI